MKTALERFEEKFIPEPNSGCWLWTAYTNPAGYGTFRGYGKNALAHRFSYEAYIKPIPEGMTLDHLCRVRGCVNPAHLEPVPLLVNLARGDTWKPRPQTHCNKGHELAGENIATEKNGRRCRICRNARQLSRYYERKANAN